MPTSDTPASPTTRSAPQYKVQIYDTTRTVFLLHGALQDGRPVLEEQVCGQGRPPHLDEQLDRPPRRPRPAQIRLELVLEDLEQVLCARLNLVGGLAQRGRGRVVSGVGQRARVRASERAALRMRRELRAAVGRDVLARAEDERHGVLELALRNVYLERRKRERELKVSRLMKG